MSKAQSPCKYVKQNKIKLASLVIETSINFSHPNWGTLWNRRLFFLKLLFVQEPRQEQNDAIWTAFPLKSQYKASLIWKVYFAEVRNDFKYGFIYAPLNPLVA